MDTWTSPNGQYQNPTDNVLYSQRWRSSIQSAKTSPGADHGSDHELLIAKFRLKLKKAGETTRPDILEFEVKWALGSITRNKATGGDGIPAELFQILKDETVKVLHLICQQIWKT